MNNRNINVNKKRVDYLDMAKGIGIIAVVTYHILGSLSINDEKSFYPALMEYIVTFALSIFFIVSGMLDYLKRESDKSASFPVFLKKKARGLLIPYLSFSAILLVITAVQLFTKTNGITFEILKNSFISFVTLRGISVLWFLPALFLSEMLFFIIRKLNNWFMNIIMLAILGVVLSFTNIFAANPNCSSSWQYILNCFVLTAGRVLLALLYIWVGFLLMKLLDKVNLNKIASFSTGCILLILNYPLSKMCHGIDINTMNFGNTYLAFLAGVAASFGIILIFKALPSIKPLLYLGKNSLIIMATHLDFGVIAGSTGLAYYLLKYIPKAKLIALYFMILLFISVLEYLLILLFNKFLSKLIGK